MLFSGNRAQIQYLKNSKRHSDVTIFWREHITISADFDADDLRLTAASFHAHIVRPHATKWRDWCLGKSRISYNSNHPIFFCILILGTLYFNCFKKGAFPAIFGDFLVHKFFFLINSLSILFFTKFGAATPYLI